MKTESPPDLLVDGPLHADHTLVLGHGAGAGRDTPFMDAFARGLGDRGVRVVRFEFPYMAARRTTGRHRPPDREPVLRETWHRVVSSLASTRLAIGGKSLGGRIASLVADELEVDRLVCLGYPFHPVGKSQLRTEHLETICTPTLIVQGERDPFGTRQEVAGYRLSERICIHWLKDGDHSFKPRKTSGATLETNWQEAIEVIERFLQQC